MKNLETKVGFGLCTLALGTILTLAASMPPHGTASASGYGIDEVLVSTR